MDRAVISWRGGARTEASETLERAEAERNGLSVEATLAGGTLVSGDAKSLSALEGRGIRVKLLRDTNVLNIGSNRIDV